jgi:invasion protein IalB
VRKTGREGGDSWSCGVALSAALLFCAFGGEARAQAGGTSGTVVPKPPVAKASPEAPQPPAMKVAGNFGQWALVCGETKDEAGREPCSLVQALVEHDSQKVVFRLTVAYGPRGNLVFRIDSPNGVALQRGLEFSPNSVKIYRMPFETCLAQGCSALLLIQDDLKQDLQKAQKGTITVYALSGQAVQAVTELSGFAEGLAALDKRRGAKP